MWLLAVGLLGLLVVGVACGADLAITAHSYGMGGLFTNPLIPVEKDRVKITVRATVVGDVPENIPAQIDIIAPGGSWSLRCHKPAITLSLPPAAAR